MRTIRALVIAIVGVVALTAGGPAAHADKKGDVLRFANDQTPESLDPYFNNVQIGQIVSHHVWDHLIERDPKTGEYRPSLATAWRWIDDTTLEFDLRQGVKFHNGDTFGPDDVVYTLNYVSNPANRVVARQNVDWIAGADKTGANQVRVRLKTPFPAAIDYLAGPVVIFPGRYYAEVGPAGMSAKPIGSGPLSRGGAPARSPGAV